MLDPDPSRRLFRSEARLTFLRRRAESPGDVLSFVVSQVVRDQAVRRSKLLLKSKFGAADISNAVSRLAAEGVLVLAGAFAVDITKWQPLRHRAAGAIEAYHRAHPEKTGLSLSDLRANIEADLPYVELFEPLVADLCRSEFIRVGNAIRRVTHRSALPPLLHAAATKMRAAMAAKPFDPPSRKQLAPDPISQQALRFLIETGEAVEINAEVVMAAESLKRMTELIRQCIQENGSATVSQLRQKLACSRR